MNNLDDFTCMCGHRKDSHGTSLNLGPYCDVCWEDKHVSTKNSYHKFKPDNLLYLERKYDSTR